MSNQQTADLIDALRNTSVTLQIKDSVSYAEVVEDLFAALDGSD